MDGPSFREPGSGKIVGEAIVGSGEYLAFTPCHRRPVRLIQAQVRPRNTVRCSADGRLWEVSFVKSGADWLAVWAALAR